MYAILDTGGRQYRVEPDQTIAVDKLPAEQGETVVFDRVAFVEREGKVRVGAPWVKGARVTCRVLSHGRGRKLHVSTYKPKDNIKRKLGHRQPYTRLRVEKITLGRTRAATKKET